MLRKGRWKYHHYIGFPLESFDLDSDPEELTNLAIDVDFADMLTRMEQSLRAICAPEVTDAQASEDQAALIERHGDRDAALKL